jgi:uncharacterized protein YutE (UPF0331/DUF86 family)
MKVKAYAAGDRDMPESERLLSFLEESLEYFGIKLSTTDRDSYFADRDIRCILDKTINDIILCIVDLCEEVLKEKKRGIPDTYRDTILSCYEFLGDIVLKIAPLVRHRNEMIHQYIKVNWQNIIAVNQKVPSIREFAGKVREMKIAR